MANQPARMEVKSDRGVLTDSKRSLGEKAPGTPFAVVALSYLAVLALSCAIIAAVIWLSR